MKIPPRRKKLGKGGGEKKRKKNYGVLEHNRSMKRGFPEKEGFRTGGREELPIFLKGVQRDSFI